MSKFAIFLILLLLLMLTTSISLVVGVLTFSDSEAEESLSLVAQRTSEDPASPEHKFWDSAPKLELKTSPNMPTYKVESLNVTLKAAYNDSNTYIYLKKWR